MTPNELKVAFSRLGCRVEIVRTGDPRYQRGFIKKGSMSYGRAVIFEGELSHIKWYGGNSRDPNCQANVLQWSWAVLQDSGRVLTSREWYQAWEYAQRKVEEDFQAKLAWRRANPRVDKNGAPRSRKRLQRRNPRQFLMEALLEVTQ